MAVFSDLRQGNKIIVDKAKYEELLKLCEGVGASGCYARQAPRCPRGEGRRPGPGQATRAAEYDNAKSASNAAFRVYDEERQRNEDDCSIKS